MARPPQAVRKKVVAKLYQEFDSLKWEQLATKEKSEAYERFLTDPGVGGELDPYMDAGSVRVWIKDGPAKEYTRALEGVGPYANHTTRAYPSTLDVIGKVLGADWSLVADSLAEKPMRCEAESPSGERRFVIWGPYMSLKELVWHSLLHRAKHAEAVPLLVVTRVSIGPLPPEHRKISEGMCELIGAEFQSIVRVASAKADTPG